LSRSFHANDLDKLALASSPAVSQDGSLIAFTKVRPDTELDRDTSSIWVVSSGGGAPRRLTRGNQDFAPVWRPGGLALSFLRAVDGGAPQLWSIDADGGEPVQLTDDGAFPNGAGAAVWADDNTTMYFSAPVSIAGAQAPANAPLVANRLDYKADGHGYMGALRSHVFSVNTLDGTHRQVTDGDWHAGEPALSPDGARLAFTAARDEDRDLAQSSRAWFLDLKDAALTVRPAGAAAAVSGPVQWVNDGTAILAVGMAKTEIRNTALLRLSIDPDVPDVSLTPGIDRNVMPGGAGYPGGRPQLLPDEEVLLCLRDGGNTHVYAASQAGDIRPVLVGEHRVVSGLSAAGGTVAVVVATQERFGDLATVAEDGTLTYLTSLTTAGLPEVALVNPEPRSFSISDGSTVHGWLIRDEAKQSGPAPLLLDVHGGPHNAWTGVAETMHPYHQMLAAKGWSILILNSRGSDGYGEEFMRGVQNAWGQADHIDFMEPIDDLIARGIADPDRLAVTGYSYGGFATCDLTSKSNRFQAAVAGGLVCDLQHLTGASDLGVFLARTELDISVQEGVAAAAELSPITRVASVTTPTLVLHGAADYRCPVNQAEQWFAALRLNGVPTQLVLYPGQSHAFILEGALSHRIDYSTRLVDWLERHVPRRSPIPAALDKAHWQHRLESLVSKYQVPGAVFGVLREGSGSGDGTQERMTIGAGITNLNTGAGVTPDTIFQIGSIGKTWTATLVMQLVAEGKLDLDAPICDILPAFTLQDKGAAATITMRHLLTHTSGIDGDIFTDTGRGDDCVEKFVDSLGDAEQLFAPGATWSYCNTGLIVAGRVVEVLRGMSWDKALTRYILEPLGLKQTTTLPEETALHHFAVGHLGTGAEMKVTPTFLIPRSAGPAGLISASADDVLTFAATFLRPDGSLLPVETLEAMLAPQVRMDHACTMADEWAIGWCLQDWGGVPTVNHNGGTFGQSSYLRLFPEQGVAIFLSVNGGQAEAMHRELLGEAGAVLANACMPDEFVPSGEADVSGSGADDASRLHEYAGRYEAAGNRIHVELSDGQWRATVTDTSGMVTDGQEKVLRLATDASGMFGAIAPDGGGWVRVSFEAPGGARLMHWGTRAYPLVVDRA
jgi:dipeptidyl aminopeptidase/acylaminoacyl peptidase/CubicO group peptidase (beta-lactamase class C family)